MQSGTIQWCTGKLREKRIEFRVFLSNGFVCDLRLHQDCRIQSFHHKTLDDKDNKWVRLDQLACRAHRWDAV